MRIIAGDWRGRRLTSVGKGDAKAHLRPTTDRTRESLFSVLQGGRFGNPVDDARVLDLFAGTGALGLEALSRGAAECVFVDKGRVAGRLLAENINALVTDKSRAKIVQGDARKMAKSDYRATLVFLDPPYGSDLGQDVILSAARMGWIAPGALIVWEENAPQAPPTGFENLETKRYGDTWITFLRYAPQS